MSLFEKVKNFFFFIVKNDYYFSLEKYSTFKKNIHQLFPTLFDTKYLSYELKKVLQKEGMFSHEQLLKYLFRRIKIFIYSNEFFLL